MSYRELMTLMEGLGYYAMGSSPVDHACNMPGFRLATLPGGGELKIFTMRSGDRRQTCWKRVVCRRTGRYVHIYTDDTVDEIVAKIEGQEKLL